MRRWLSTVSLMIFGVLAARVAGDTLVLCPRPWQHELAPWLAYRRAQGHAITVANPPVTPSGIARHIRQVAEQGNLRYVLLVGDVDQVGTNYVNAVVNVRWGSSATIASDVPFADTNGDRLPNIVVARIPVDSAYELRRVLTKSLQYEASSETRKGIDVVAGAGGFGATVDGVIELAARQVMATFVPPSVTVSITKPSADAQQNRHIVATVRRQLRGDALAWVYLGHGHPASLDAVPTANGPRAMLTVDDLRHWPRATTNHVGPLAVIIACYTGSFDGPRDCLAEHLLKQPHGPVAVVAATRVSMPYGNAVIGSELLRAQFELDATTLGSTWLQAQRRTIAAEYPARDADIRISLDQLARGLMPPPVDLDAERREHVAMYHLLGDPLLRLRPINPPKKLRMAGAAAGVKQSRARREASSVAR